MTAGARSGAFAERRVDERRFVWAFSTRAADKRC
jgi:hypothetical protein